MSTVQSAQLLHAACVSSDRASPEEADPDDSSWAENQPARQLLESWAEVANTLHSFRIQVQVLKVGLCACAQFACACLWMWVLRLRCTFSSRHSSVRAYQHSVLFLFFDINTKATRRFMAPVQRMRERKRVEEEADSGPPASKKHKAS